MLDVSTPAECFHWLQTYGTLHKLFVNSHKLLHQDSQSLQVVKHSHPLQSAGKQYFCDMKLRDVVLAI